MFFDPYLIFFWSPVLFIFWCLVFFWSPTPKSCTTKDDDYRIICRVLTIPGGAGFFPSTVSLWKQHSWVSQSAHSSSTGKAREVQGMWGGWRMLPSGLKMVMNPEMIWNACGNICCNYKTTKKMEKMMLTFFLGECCGDHQPKLRNICVLRNDYRVSISSDSIPLAPMPGGPKSLELQLARWGRGLGGAVCISWISSGCGLPQSCRKA